MKIKAVLISQPRPESDRSPYFDIARNHKVQVDFQPFIGVEGVPANEIRKQKIDLSEFGCIILTSKNSVDHYFRLAGEMRFSVPESNKYFCTTEAIALYLQKYIVFRKRKIFFGQTGLEDLADTFKKNKTEKFLFPCSDKHTDKIAGFLKKAKVQFTPAVFYRTVATDMKDIPINNYDMLIFFSPNGVESLVHNFPNFEQGEMHIGVFGDSTAKAAEEAGLKVHLKAPLPKAPSMTMALDWYLKQNQSKK
jgi:uroporphyrinogen-III synthase